MALDNYINVSKEKFPVDKIWMKELVCIWLENYIEDSNSEEGAKCFYNVISYRDDTPESKDETIGYGKGLTSNNKRH